MSDLISRSALMEKSFVLEGHRVVSYVDLIEAPTAYDVEKVVEELESFAKLAEDRWVNGTSTHAYQEHKCWVKAIDIVRKGGVL